MPSSAPTIVALGRTAVVEHAGSDRERVFDRERHLGSTRQPIAVVSLAAIAVVVAWKGGSELFSKSPSDAFKAAYMAANAGRYLETEKHLSSETLKLVKGELGAL